MNWDDEAEPPPALPTRDTELTLGATALIILCFILVALCGVSFVVGYIAGSYSSSAPPIQSAKKAVESVAALPGKMRPKTSLSSRSASSQQGTSAAKKTSPSPHPSIANPSASNTPATKPSAPHAPLNANATVARPSAATHAAAPNPPVFMVQIAALPIDRDADKLVGALHQHGYTVSIRREADHLIHIRIGPFTRRSDALAMKTKLLHDGYNTVIQ